jgi:hypothetical protein
VETGNVAIEMEYNGQPSGIVTTQAAWWGIVVGFDAYLVKADELRRLVARGIYRKVPAGDGLRSLVVLVPLDDLRHAMQCKVIPIAATASN